MDSNKPFTVASRRICGVDKKSGVDIEIKVVPCQRVDGMIVVQIWGETKLSLPVEMAELFAEALLRCKEEVEDARSS
jgi:hypothetical protein